MRKCRHCGFNNPDGADKCLQCGYDLPITVGEAKKAFSVFGDMASGRWKSAGKKVAEGVVEEKVKDLKVRANPLWWLKVKVFRAKQSCITCLIIWGIIIAMAIIGGILSKFK